ncbi:hypothetical protein [Serratia proteamaculans]|uniref:hypothetical protein n=1 Tax=Serratia proteamaculans TaxID=28151 RepID=UPI003CED4E46
MFNLLKLLLFSGPDKFLSPLNSDKEGQRHDQAGRVHVDDNGNAFINVEVDEFQRVFARHIQALRRY